MRRYVRIVTVGLLTLFSVGLAMSTFIYFWVPYEDTGISFDLGVVNTVPAGSPAAKAGLRVGDRFDLATPFFDRQVFVSSFQPARGQTYRFKILRDGVLRDVSVHASRATAVPPWSFQDIVEYVVGMLSFFTLILVGMLLVLVRPNPLTWLFFLFCVGNPTAKYFNAVDVISGIHMPLGFILNLIRIALMVVGYVAFVYFALRFPNMRASGWRARVERFLPLLFVFYLAYIYLGWFLWPYPVNVGPVLGWPYFSVAISLLFEIIAVVSLAGTYRGSSPKDKHRFSWVITGVLVTYSVLLLRDGLGAFNMLEGDTLWICICSQSLSAFAPVALAYGTLKHRVIDASFVVNRAVVYGAVIAVLVIVFESFSWLFERLIQQTRTVEVLQLVLAIAIGISVQHSFKRIEAIVNRWIFKSVHDAQQHLSRIAATLLSVESSAALEHMLVTEPVDVLKLTAGAVFRGHAGTFERTAALGWSDKDNTCFEAGDPLVLNLRSRHAPVSITDTAFPESYVLAKTKCADEALPIFSQGVLMAIVLYGPHVNGTRIDPNERSALANLAAAAEQAYDTLRIRSTNVRRLSELLERIDGKVPYDEVHHYLADQVIQTVSEQTRIALLACAVIPQPTAEDIVYATGDENDIDRLKYMLSSSSLIRLNQDGVYTLHPLIRHALLTRARDKRKDMLLRCARAWEERQEHARAARLYSAAGMRQDAAHARAAASVTT